MTRFPRPFKLSPMSSDNNSEATTLLCINSGSSSLKFAFYEVAADDEYFESTLIIHGVAERIGQDAGRLTIEIPEAEPISAETSFADHLAAVNEIFRTLDSAEFPVQLPAPTAIGHRVVHGGLHHVAPVEITPEVLSELKHASSLVPLHQPGSLLGIEALSQRFPQVTQVACFDTAFFQDLPELAQRLPLPARYHEEGLRRFGFHGLSYEFVRDNNLDSLGERTIIAHLGSGSSLVALLEGEPIDTTMGLTPTAGCLMGTRTGDIDPGVLLYLLKEKGMSPEQLEQLINRESGLLGISGITSDMETLIEQMEDNEDANFAIDAYCYSVRKQIGALAAALGGLDMLIFTGGIGEESPHIRQWICEGLEFLGIELDEEENEEGAEVISAMESSCEVLVYPTDEMFMIAQHTQGVLDGKLQPVG